MASIQKVAVYDPRIVQDAPAYAVQKGALAVAVSPFQAVSATTSQHTYQVLVPSLNVFVDRKILWQSTVYVQMDVLWSGATSVAYTITNGVTTPVVTPNTYGQPYVTIRPGKDFVLPMFPLQSMCTNMSASINDCFVTTNGDTLREQILLTTSERTRRQRTTPSKYDVYAWSIDDVNSINGTFGGYDQTKFGDMPNGAWPIAFVDGTGADITPSTSPAGRATYIPYTNTAPGVSYNVVPAGQTNAGVAATLFYNGLPCWTPQMDATKAQRICFRFTVSEPLVLSPFIWQDTQEFSQTGLYGCTNMAFTMNLQASPSSNSVISVTAQAVAGSNTGGAVYYDNISSSYNPIGNLIRASGISSLFQNVTLGRPSGGNTNTSNGAFTNPQLLVSFLTPGVDVDLPLCSSVPYHEFPRYYTNQSMLDPSGIIQTQTITLASIPDMIMLWVKPLIRGQTQNETYIPIQRIGVTFDNFSNLCSNFSQANLYNSSVASGLDMDYRQWAGSAVVSTQASGLVPYNPVSAAPGGQSMGGGTYFPLACATQTVPPTYSFGAGAQPVQMTGGPLLLRMGTDISLSPGLAPGCLGNYSIQCSITLDLSSGFYAPYVNSANGSGVVITLMAISSGFFETVRGQSAIRKTLLNNTDVEQARSSASMTHSSLARMVGGSNGSFSTSSTFNHAAHLHGKGLAGAGGTGAGMAGAGMAGAGSGLYQKRGRF